MDPKLQDAKGRAKEAAGAITGNEQLKAEGQADQAGAKVQQTVDKAATAAKDAISGMSEAAQGVVDSAREHLK
jgi:uncharacterized protein YjbJ (UPF0337 family)